MLRKSNQEICLKSLLYETCIILVQCTIIIIIKITEHVDSIELFMIGIPVCVITVNTSLSHYNVWLC